MGRFAINWNNFEEVMTLPPGRFGVVRIVRNRATNSIQTVKSFNPYRFPDNSNPFENLMNWMSSLNHPCIVKIQNFTIPRNGIGPVLVSDYVNNGSMEDIIQKQGLDNNQITHTQMTIMILGIVLGMNYLHNCGIIHGLLKPSDLLVDRDYRVRITDFATMKMEQLKAIKASQVGSPCYMAPEVYEDDYVLTKKVDIFAFGFILFELISGSKIFPATMSAAWIMRQIMKGIRPPLPSNIDYRVAKIIKKCWSVKPCHRPSFAKILHKFKKFRFEIFDDVDVDKVQCYITEMESD
jgi:serine/threonine protein kinase